MKYIKNFENINLNKKNSNDSIKKLIESFYNIYEFIKNKNYNIKHFNFLNVKKTNFDDNLSLLEYKLSDSLISKVKLKSFDDDYININIIVRNSVSKTYSSPIANFIKYIDVILKEYITIKEDGSKYDNIIRNYYVPSNTIDKISQQILDYKIHLESEKYNL